MFITRDKAPHMLCCYSIWVGNKTSQKPELLEDGIWDMHPTQFEEKVDSIFFNVRSFTKELFETLTNIRLEPGEIIEVDTLIFTDTIKSNDIKY